MSTAATKIDATPLISILIACYKGEKFIAATIESVLAQTYPNFELVVIDDGSPDDSVSVVRRYTHDARVKYVHQQNGGMSAARNAGIQHSTGEFLVFLDQDDCLVPEALEIGLRSFQTYPDCGFVFGSSYFIDAEGDPLIAPTLERISDGIAPRDYGALLTGKGLAICPLGSVMFRRSAIAQVGSFDRTYGLAEDYDMYLKVARQFPIHFHGAVIAAYRQHGENNSYKTVSMMNDFLKVLDAQKPFVAQHRQYRAALQAGQARWRNMFTATSLFNVIWHLYKGRWGMAFQLGKSLLPGLRFDAIPFYCKWIYRMGLNAKRRPKRKTVHSTEQLVSLMQEKYEYRTN